MTTPNAAIEESPLSLSQDSPNPWPPWHYFIFMDMDESLGLCAFPFDKIDVQSETQTVDIDMVDSDSEWTSAPL